MMLLAQIAAIEARANAATKGPWEVAPTVFVDEPVQVGRNFNTTPSGGYSGDWIAEFDGQDETLNDKANADFCAAAREDVPALCAALRLACEALRECVGDLIWCSGSNDFSPEGQARIGWMKGPAQSIERGNAALASIERIVGGGK